MVKGNQKYQEEGLDILELLNTVWNGRRTVLIITGVFMALGVLAAVTMKRTYTVSSVMVPQMSGARTYSLATLAGLSGFDMGASAGSDLSPLVYPEIVGSVSFRVELMNTPLHFEKLDTTVSLVEYMKDYQKLTVMDNVKKYTIGLPFLLLSKLKKPAEDTAAPSEWEEQESVGPRPYILSKEEVGMLGYMEQAVKLNVEKKDGYFTLVVRGIDPIQTADLAVKAQELLQEKLTSFRTEKSEDELEYIQARYNEIKKESESLQASLAVINDRSQNLSSAYSRIERDRLQTRYTVVSAVYTEMAKQLEQAKMKVKRDTPVITVVQPVTVPSKPSNSRARKVIVWTFLGIVLGCGVVLGKSFVPTVVENIKAGKPE